DTPESDGTLSWDSTTIVIALARAGGRTGLGLAYTAAAAAELIDELLAEAVVGCDALSPAAAWERMRRAVRNVGYAGVAASAISAVDISRHQLVRGARFQRRSRGPAHAAGTPARSEEHTSEL